MSAPASIIRDVFRQAWATGLTATLIAVTILAAIGCLTLQLSAGTASQIEMTALFGSISVVVSNDATSATAHWQFLLSGIVADTMGVLLTLVWTASFLPSFLDSRAVSVILAKPTSRAMLLLSRYFGVVFYVATMAAMFVGLTWIAMGVRIGDWNGRYWISVPILVGHFAVFFAFSALLAVMSRNATVCIVGTVLFWAMCWAMNYGRHVLAAIHLQEASASLGQLTEYGYWVLPKPLDFGLALAEFFGTDQTIAQWLNLRSVREAGLFHPAASIASSLVAGAAFLGLATYEFTHDEY